MSTALLELAHIEETFQTKLAKELNGTELQKTSVTLKTLIELIRKVNESTDRAELVFYLKQTVITLIFLHALLSRYQKLQKCKPLMEQIVNILFRVLYKKLVE